MQRSTRRNECDDLLKLLLLCEHGSLADQCFGYRRVRRAQGLFNQRQCPSQGCLSLCPMALLPQLQCTLHLHAHTHTHTHDMHSEKKKRLAECLGHMRMMGRTEGWSGRGAWWGRGEGRGLRLRLMLSANIHASASTTQTHNADHALQHYLQAKVVASLCTD